MAATLIGFPMAQDEMAAILLTRMPLEIECHWKTQCHWITKRVGYTSPLVLEKYVHYYDPICIVRTEALLCLMNDAPFV